MGRMLCMLEPPRVRSVVSRVRDCDADITVTRSFKLQRKRLPPTYHQRRQQRAQHPPDLFPLLYNAQALHRVIAQ